MPTRKQDWALLLTALIVLVAWTAAALTPALAAADLSITRWLQQGASRTLDVLFSTVTVIGNFEITVVLAGLLGVALIRAAQTRLAVTLWAVFTGGSIIEWITKHWLPHPNVPESLQRHGINILHHVFHAPYSYLSGHAFRSMLLATVTSWVWTRSSTGSQRLRLYLLGVMVVLMGVALVYLGDHWATDVIGGYLLAALCIVLLRFLRDRRTTAVS
jgi:undecaprenyl-diphosphatase